jgi:2'-5' RNA ligase
MKNEFQSLKSWINESKKEERTYGCVMLDTKIDKWEELHLEGIDEDDIYENDNDDYGLEENPHMTLLYGIHEDEIDPSVVHSVMEKNLHPVTVMITHIGCFENEDYDVVKYDVPVTKEIAKYRKMLEKTFPNTQKFKDFHPHITISYVKSGEGKKYAKELEEPFEVTFNKAVYSWHEEKNGKIETIRKQYVFPKEELNTENK